VSPSWYRPYSPGRGRWWIVAWEACGLGFLHWTTVRLFDVRPPVSWALAAAVALLWVVGSWRILTMGVYLSDYGLRNRGLVATTTVRWSDVERITIEQVVSRIAGWAVPSGKSIVVTLHDGSRVNTSLWEQGIDFHDRPEVFYALGRELRERLMVTSTGRAERAGPTP
jgi:hypothetical protein